jgi:hypothetical protein
MALSHSRKNFKAFSADIKRYDVHSIPTKFSIPCPLTLLIACSTASTAATYGVSFYTGFPIPGAGPVSLVGI